MLIAPLTVHRVVARNRAADHPNKVHDDDFARAAGFRAGLVPGVDVYAYMTHPVVAAWGEAWLRGGAMAVRFEKPVCDGDQVEIRTTPEDGERLLVELTTADGVRRARGTARRAGDQAAPTADGYPWRPLPAQPPLASPEVLRSTPVLGAVDHVVEREEGSSQLTEVEETLDVYARAAIVHPGHLLRFADRVLSANVRLQPWMHVSSEVQHFDVAHYGAPLSTRARVLDVFERKGHRFVQLDVLVLKAPASPVMRVSPYTAIYEPAFLRAPGEGRP